MKEKRLIFEPEPTELLVRWFRRAKTNPSQKPQVGDFARVVKSDPIGISLWRISYITPQDIYTGFFSDQRMGLFSAQTEKLKTPVTSQNV